jgi:TolB-like protein/tetratricopeptide (TPR) repeat protein
VVANLPDVFLSYSREDQATVRRYAEALEREGFKVWWDSALNPGETFDQVTEQALKEAKAVVVLWSKTSVTSRWVRSEATQADRFGTLVPVTIEPCDRPIMFELTHTMDLSGWNGDRNQAEWRAFVTGLKRLVEKGGTSIAPAPAAMPAPTQKTRSTALAWAAAALVVIGAGLYWHFHSRDENTATTVAGSPAATSAKAATPAPLASIAVLPFKDMSQNKDQEYFADGVTEEILNTLAGLKDLKVTARTSAFAFKGKDVDLRTVGETLGVQHILEGSIRKDGETLRITAQLIDVKSDAHLWSKTYDRPVKDVFSVQENIARSVAEALQVSLGVGFGARPGMTRDVEAYDAYLQARALWPLWTAVSRRRAVELLQQAVDRDRNFADAWRIMADFCASMPGLEGRGLAAGDAQGWMKRSEAAFAEFARLTDGTPTLYRAIATRSLRAGRYAEAARQLKKAGDTSASPGLGWEEMTNAADLLSKVGRPHDAVAELERVLARDPLLEPAIFFLGHAYSAAGNVQASYAAWERADRLTPGSAPNKGGGLVTAMGARDKAQVRRWLDAVIDVAPDAAGKQFATRIKALQDKPPEARAMLRERVRDPSLPAFNLGISSIFMAYFDAPEDALEALHSPRFGAPAGLDILDIWGPVFRDMRKLPAFREFVRDIGLVDYWREFGWGEFCKPTTGEDFECN